MKGRRYPQPLAQPSLRAVRTVIPRFATDFVVLQFAPKASFCAVLRLEDADLGGTRKEHAPLLDFTTT